MQAANRAFLEAKTHIGLYRGKVNSMLGELATAPRAHESASRILDEGWFDGPRAGDIAIPKFHLLRLFFPVG